jgi:hypothetical protein
MVAIVAVRQDIDDNFLFREYNYVYLDFVKKEFLADPNYNESELPFLSDDIKMW